MNHVAEAVPNPSRAAHTGPQAAPVPFPVPDGRSGSLKVDRVVRVGGRTLVAGWRTEEVELSLLAEGEVSDTIFHTARPDVAQHFGLAPSTRLGFVLVGPANPAGLELVCGAYGKQVTYPLQVEPGTGLDEDASTLVTPALAWLASEVEPFSDEWVRLISLIPSVAGADDRMSGAFDEAVASASVRRGMASGWVTVPPDALVWLQDSHGGIHDLNDAFRSHRDDVRTVLSKTLVSAVQHKPGFSRSLEGVDPGTRLHLRMFDGSVVRELAEATISTLPADPVEASRLLFAAPGVPMSRLAERFSSVEVPILEALVSAHRSSWPRIPVRVQQVGERIVEPATSIIIPLYGRSDFVEHQMLEFSQDEWLLRSAEIIYVIDDRSLVERFTADAHQMHRLYKVPFRIVWGGINRGFAGANNLGAEHASAPRLLFMNSDVFPCGAGWLQPLLQVLDEHEDVGVVAPRLLFADGSIQHAGMEFQRRDELGIWINHHPRMGLDPSLDPHVGLTSVPAVTGACMALHRTDFDQVGGWDHGYLIGDFEDSDLCLKLRERGLKSAYLPEVSLTHLERQSFRLLGEGDYRTRVVIYNALRHQRRWSGLLETSEAERV